MVKPAPKTALRKAPAAVHPIAPAEVIPAMSEMATSPTATPVETAPLTMFSVRMDRALRRRVKQYAAGSDLSLQDVVAAALSEYLERREA